VILSQVKNNLKFLGPPNFNVNGVVISLESKNLLTKMLKYDPSERIKWNEIYDHPLFAKHDGL
jgi:serine/threonine protein kinase